MFAMQGLYNESGLVMLDAASSRALRVLSPRPRSRHQPPSRAGGAGGTVETNFTTPFVGLRSGRSASNFATVAATFFYQTTDRATKCRPSRAPRRRDAAATGAPDRPGAIAVRGFAPIID